jgi:hypothetical protein
MTKNPKIDGAHDLATANAIRAKLLSERLHPKATRFRPNLGRCPIQIASLEPHRPTRRKKTAFTHHENERSFSGARTCP